MARFPAVLSVALLAGAAGCSDYDITRYEGVDVFNQNPADEVDVLLVVDNSGSMQPYQDQLGSSFDQFITYFTEANVDYHIGVTTTDVEALDAGRIRGQVITPNTENASDVFDALVNVGTMGSGFEMGLEGARIGLTEPVLSNYNVGFLRPEASLSLIFVSDEEDSSPYATAQYINTFFDVKGMRDRDVFNASALTVTDISECTPAQADWSSPGTRYIDVAERTHGVIGNLCSSNFENIVVDLSMASSRLRDTFYLSDWPDTSSLRVSVDDELIPCTDGSWWYEVQQVDGEETPTIVFDRTSMPPVDSRLTVRYDYGAGDVETFCTDDTSEPAE